MSIVSQGRDFGEYYDELVSRERTIDDELKDVRRGEVAGRRAIELECSSDFADMLHIMGIMIGEKKLREKGGGPKLDKFELAIYEKQRAVWFPAAPPRQVAPPTRRLTTGGFPHTQFQDLCEEEAELRRWVHGVEKKLRGNIERACSESWFILTCFQQLYAHEARGRVRLNKEEHEGFAAIRKSVFHLAPADLFRQQVVERYGATHREPTPHPELTFEETEELRRHQLEEEEFESRKNTFKYLHDAYDAYLFMEHHKEICNRLAIMEEEDGAVFSVVAQCGRESFGFLNYYTPTVAFHCDPQVTPFLAELAIAYRGELDARGAAALESFEEAKQAYAEGRVVPFEEIEMIEERERLAKEAAEREAEAEKARAEATEAAATGVPAVPADATAEASPAGCPEGSPVGDGDAARYSTGSGVLVDSSSRPISQQKSTRGGSSGGRNRPSVVFVQVEEAPERPVKHSTNWDNLGVAPEEDEPEAYKAFASGSDEENQVTENEQYVY